MNVDGIYDHVFEGRWLPPLFTNESSVGGNTVNKLLAMIKPEHEKDFMKRYEKIFTAVEPVLNCLKGEACSSLAIHTLLAHYLKGETPRRIFLAGGSSAYLLGRFV